MGELRAELQAMSLVGRWAVVGIAVAGTAGSIAGLIIGLNVRPATAWFALFELGIPAGIAGGLVGFSAALIVIAERWLRRKWRRPA